jgi:hypothetical protein
MRKLFVLFALIIILAFSAFVPMASAQTTESAGCTATDSLFDSGLGPYTFGPYTYLAGERITLTFAGTATSSFSVDVNGTSAGSGLIPPTTLDYDVPADGSYTFVITVSNGTTGNSVSADCLSADEVPTYAPGTICHIPPGNPNAAHTITVGLPAVDAHLAHGDTEGPCPDGVDTRYDNPSIGITIFIIFATGEIQVYGNCDDSGECDEVTNVPISEVIDFTLIIVDGSFVDVPEGEEDENDYELPDSAPADGIAVVIYYLHPDPNNSSVGVFQINVYQNGVLVDDSILLFITTDGTIILWTSHNIWDEQLAAFLEEED